MPATKAEYIAASEAEMEAVWIRKFISGLGIVPTINEPIRMYCDNSAALHFANEPGVQKGARHYHRRYHYVRESIELGEIKFLKVHTDDNLADPFTKALSNKRLTQHARSMGLPDLTCDEYGKRYPKLITCRKAISNGAKGKRSVSSNKANGEIKAKPKIMQNSTRSSASISGPHGKIFDQDKLTISPIPKLEIRSANSFKENVEDDEAPLDFSQLELPEMDVLGGEQGQDLLSWLNIDDEVLQDDDFMGFQIPMDDLSDTKTSENNHLLRL
ncbi:hypothetical protein Tco_0978940 [Tanacetum coccineum]|uniref:Uncharacterized protein n=1 Tax=Tanacetum coccineum TaxID=301880 RepID=A0ABQ5EPB0_9ASTR